MGRNKSLKLQHHHVDAIGEEEIHENHTDGRQLGGNGDEVEVGFGAALILRSGVAHGENESFAEYGEW